MKISTVKIDNVKDLGMVNSVSVYGIGIITSFIYSLFSFLGMQSTFMTNKMAKVINSATDSLKSSAAQIGADGVMNVQYQMTMLCVMAYGTAFKYDTETATEDELPEL